MRGGGGGGGEKRCIGAQTCIRRRPGCRSYKPQRLRRVDMGEGEEEEEQEEENRVFSSLPG